MSEGLDREEVHQAVDRAVEELLAEAGVGAPPVDAVALARGRLRLVLPLDRGRASKQPLARGEPTREQLQWSAAHEIGRHLLPELLRRLDVDPTQKGMSGASLANLFADRLLVPGRWLAAEARASGYDLPALKETFGTAGFEAIAWRLLDLQEPCIITLLDNDHVHRRRSNSWRVNRELSEPEKRCQRYVHEYSRPHRVAEGGWTVQGWPLHQSDWKREVLRSVPPE
jgi:hypothetical protein